MIYRIYRIFRIGVTNAHGHSWATGVILIILKIMLILSKL